MLVPIYAVYLITSIALTIWIGRTLYRNGRVLLAANFKHNEALADAISQLLLVGFYLINLGFICLILKYGEKPRTLEQGIEFLSMKEGFIIMLLGFMHYLFNMLLLTKYRHLKIFNP